MKVSKAKLAENRGALLDSASRLIKQKGFEGAGVAEISANAGLTQGGFYGQFATKSALAAEACKEDFSGTCAEWEVLRGTTGDDALAYVVDYLRKEHVHNIAGGCPMAAYSGEIVRQDVGIASAFAEGTAGMIRLMEDALITRMPPADARSKAIFLIAALSGTVAMTRAIGRSDPDLASDMLNAALKEAQLLATG